MAETTCRHPDSCPRPSWKRGWCSMHYWRIRTHGEPGPVRKLSRWGEAAKVCTIDGCEEVPRANDVCDVHYQRIRKNGEPGPAGLLRRRSTPETRSWTLGERHRFYKYGLKPEAFDQMLAAQGGRCHICGTDEPTAKGWSVDHCHETNVVRFIACNPCNAALGLIKEDPRIAKRLYEVALECQQLRLT